MTDVVHELPAQHVEAIGDVRVKSFTGGDAQRWDAFVDR